MVEVEVSANASQGEAKLSVNLGAPSVNFGVERDDLEATVDFSRAEPKKRPVILSNLII